MLNPAIWPETNYWTKRIYLKRPQEGRNWDFGQLAYLDGKWGFCPESEPYEPEVDKVKWGGEELIEEILKDGWRVD